MDRRTFLSALSVVITATPHSVVARETRRSAFKDYMISSGANHPRIEMTPELNEILAGFHHGLHSGDIRVALDVDKKRFAGDIDALIDEGLLHKKNAQLQPSAPVITFSDERYFLPDPLTIQSIADAIIGFRHTIEHTVRTLEGFKSVPSRNTSLLLYSDLLLDNGQIDGIEADFLGVPRPLRRGGRYYYALFEQRANQTCEPFGIYGNAFEQVGNVEVNLYGNARYGGLPNLVTLSAQDAQAKFGVAADVSASDAKRQIVGAVLSLWKGDKKGVPAAMLQGLTRLGLTDSSGNVLIPVLSQEDGKALYALAARFRPTLLKILNANRPTNYKRFAATPYAAEGVSFAEWWIWSYHFLYTAVTNRLIGQGLITMPIGGTVTYLTVES